MASPRWTTLAGIIMVSAASIALVGIAIDGGGGTAGLATELEWRRGSWYPDRRAATQAERAEKEAKEKEQELLRQVWGLEPHGTRHIAPEESIVHHLHKQHEVARSRRKWAPERAAGAIATSKPAQHKTAVAKSVTRAKPVEKQDGASENAAAVHPRVVSRHDEVDSTLARLKAKAKKLGVNFKGKKLTQLDDLPIPDLEYGSTTPDIPFPAGTTGAENKASTQTLAQRWYRTRFDEADPADAKFEDAGINVNTADTMFPDQSGDRDVDATRIYPTIQFAQVPKKTTLYAPAWSPDYLEPARHAPTDHAAWEWIAKAKQDEKRFEEEQVAKLQKPKPSADSAKQGKAGQTHKPHSQAKAEPAERSRHGYGSAWELPRGPMTSARKEREEAIAQAWGLGQEQEAAAAKDSDGAANREARAAVGQMEAVNEDEQLARKDEVKAHLREQRALHELYGTDADPEDTLEQSNKAATMSLAEINKKHEHSAKTVAVAKDPCPWYGCADGSDSSAAWQKHQDVLAAQLKVKEHKLAQRRMDQVTDLNSKTEQLLGFPTVESPTQKLLSHGFGTTNAFKADPITTPHDQFYGGDHRFYGSDLPVFARGEGSSAPRSTKSHVRAHEAYAVDGKTKVFDLDEPHSFDSVPLASPSSFLSRVEAHYPNGYNTAHPTSPGKLQAKVFRGQVLADWRKYEHGLTNCMEAEATIDPNLQDYSCKDVSTGLSYLQTCMQNHEFGLESVGEKGGLKKGAWGALPELVQMTYQLHPKDYQTVHQVLSNSAVFGTLWNMERLHARCAATGSAVKYRTRGSRVRQIDSEVKYLDRLLKWWNPGTPEMQKGEAIIQGAYHGLPWEHDSQARGAARNYWTYTNSKHADSSAYPNLPAENQFYGPETGYYAEDWNPDEKTRAGLPRWRVPAGGDEDVTNPAGEVGSLGDYTMQQPRAKLEAEGPGFPVVVNGQFVDPENPRPWQADQGAYNPWTGYFWTGPGKYDASPEAHPLTQYTTGYNYPSTVKPGVVRPCEEDINCPASEVCSTGGFCRAWENGERWYVPANGGIWRADSGVAESWV